MLLLQKLHSNIIKWTTSIPFDNVPYDKHHYLETNSTFKIFKKFLHKYIYLRLANQIKLQQAHLPLHQKGLWLYTGKRNIGDAIMDLSGRSLLKGRITRLDLLTLPNLKSVFQEDDVFTNVFDDISQINVTDYDYILLSEFNHPSIRLKVRHFKNLKFACLFGFFYGPDRNQTLFSHHAINQIFRLDLDKVVLNQIAKPYLCSKKRLLPSGLTCNAYIALSIGGIDKDRSYQHWIELLHLIDQHESRTNHSNRVIALLGSENGQSMAKSIISQQFKNIIIQNFVGTLNILDSQNIISNAKLLIACDGGLMHIGHSTQTPSISLFRVQEPPEFRLTESCHSIPIHSTGDVNAVPAGKIYNIYTDLMGNHAHE